MRLSSHLLFDLGGSGPSFLVRLVAERPDAGRRQGVRPFGYMLPALFTIHSTIPIPPNPKPKPTLSVVATPEKAARPIVH